MDPSLSRSVSRTNCPAAPSAAVAPTLPRAAGWPGGPGGPGGLRAPKRQTWGGPSSLGDSWRLGNGDWINKNGWIDLNWRSVFTIQEFLDWWFQQQIWSYPTNPWGFHQKTCGFDQEKIGELNQQNWGRRCADEYGKTTNVQGKNACDLPIVMIMLW